MDVEILPEPSDEERQAILEALRLEADEEREPTPWEQADLRSDAAAQATAPRRKSRGAARA